jgi:putative drug exporter of the RND superfamily
LSGLARWCFQHRRIVVLGWVLAIGVLIGVTQSIGTAYSDSFTLPGTESTRALDLLSSAFPAQAGDSDTIVIHVPNGSVNDPAVKAKFTATLDKVAKAPGVSGVTSPYSPEGAGQISADGRTAYATIHFTKLANEIPKEQIQKVIDLADAARSAGIEVELGGNAIKQFSQAPPSNSEGIGLLAAGVVLFIAFGSLFAMALPLLTAIVALSSGLLTVGLISHVVTIGTVGPTLAALIGLGVGIDYALFIVTRQRAGIQAGMTPEESTIRALNTSGRAVLFAGTTVCIALLGLFVLRLSFLNGLAIPAVITVLFTVAAAVTFLPAMLGFLGMKVLSRKERRRLVAEGPHEPTAEGFWARWAAFVQRRPKILATAATLVLLILTIPLLSLRLGSSDSGNDPASSTTRKAYDLLAEGFGPGFNGPLQLVATIETPADKVAFAKLAVTLKDTPGVASVTAYPTPAGSSVGIIQVVPTTAPQDKATSDLIVHLRDTVIPAATEGTTMKVYVGGLTAIFDDFADVLTSKLPLFIGVIILLGFLLLMLAFRSLLVPATAAVMNLLAAGASFGVLVAVFQFGWGADLLSLGKPGPVEAFLPVIMLSILFGLSMDYQVFLVSRMHEEWVHTGDNSYAVSRGQATTGRVITAAATIMICVFIAFVFGGERIIAEFGVGLASAVFIDAFIIRTVLVPALMHIFGKANWWLPGVLDRHMPHLSVEPADEGMDGADSSGSPQDPDAQLVSR